MRLIMNFTADEGNKLREAINEIYLKRRGADARYGQRDFARDVGAPPTTVNAWLDPSNKLPIQKMEVTYLQALYDLEPILIQSALGLTPAASAGRSRRKGKNEPRAEMELLGLA